MASTGATGTSFIGVHLTVSDIAESVAFYR
jgi:hypothetical protein